MAKKAKKAAPINIQQFPMTVMQIDRNRKELQDWKRAMQAAESLSAPQRKTLYDLYENIVLDPHLTAVMGKRIIAVTNIDWAIKDKNGAVLEDYTKDLDTIFFEDILTEVINSRFWGFSLQEVDWVNKKNSLVPRAHVNPHNQIVLANPLMWSVGVSYNEPPYTSVCLEAGRPKDLGLLLKVAPYVIMKRNDVADWATFCEIFGMPMRVVYYDSNIPDNRLEAEKSMKDMGAAGYMVLPDGSRVEFPSTGSQQGNDTYDRFAEFCNKEISKAIVTQTMTTEDGASLSQSEVHMEAEEHVNINDIRYVRRILNERLIPIMVAQGINLPDGANFQPVEEEQTVSKRERLDMDLLIHEKVGAIPKEYFQKEYNVEFVDKSDTPPTPASTSAKESTTEPKQNKASKKQDIKNADSIWQNFLDFFAQAPKL